MNIRRDRPARRFFIAVVLQGVGFSARCREAKYPRRFGRADGCEAPVPFVQSDGRKEADDFWLAHFLQASAAFSERNGCEAPAPLVAGAGCDAAAELVRGNGRTALTEASSLNK